jgi:acyl-CoA synthetase (AMP-forming)/AMP-acid ligase II
MIQFLLDRMAERPDGLAIAEPDRAWTHGDVLARIDAWRTRFAGHGLQPGTVASIEGEYGIETIAAFLALIEAHGIAVPLSRDSAVHADAFLELGEVEARVRPGEEPGPTLTARRATHERYRTLRERQVPGLVLFSSGSTGKHKAAVHDLALLLKKFQVRRHCYRTLVFLQLDHIGGVNTLFYTLSNGGAVVVAPNRSPASVARTIETHRVELLPTSPTFLNLLLLSGEHERHDLSSLKLITYGTEAMPESTLERVAHTFPNAKLQQTYGLTEVGILRSQSRGSNSLWVRVGGEGYQTKVVDGRLWVKAESAMLGYLNAPSPFDDEGYFDTGDRVEVDGEWLRILGRETDIINVGGSKVYPAEVESVLLELDNVADVCVSGEPHALTGQIVVATVTLDHDEAVDQFKLRMRRHCAGRLPAFKVPARVKLASGPLYSSRFKRMRTGAGQTQPVAGDGE